MKSIFSVLPVSPVACCQSRWLNKDSDDILNYCFEHVFVSDKAVLKCSYERAVEGGQDRVDTEMVVSCSFILQKVKYKVNN